MVDSIFSDVDSSKPLHQRTISSLDLVDWIIQHPNHYSFLTHQLRRECLQSASREDELKEYKRLYVEFDASFITANQLYFIIAKTWWSKWIQYIQSTEEAGMLHSKRPGRIDNSKLMEEDGNRLRADLTEKKEYVIVCEPLWELLYSWYGGGPVISRRVVRSLNQKLELELYPLFLHICVCKKDAMPGEECDRLLCAKVQTVERVKKRICQITKKDPRRCRLWVLSDDGMDALLLKEEKRTLEELELCEEPFIMIEEMQDDGKFSLDEKGRRKKKSNEGLVGLENLGNTCYMNAALQCLCHTTLLRDYFVSDEYLRDVNCDNDEGANGELAIAFGSLVKNMWDTSLHVLAPRRFLNTLWCSRPQFQGYTQHDSQELLSVILDVGVGGV